jgi:transposase InsO family protein
VAVSITMDVSRGLEALAPALEVEQPARHNCDQGAQFTRLDVTERLAAAGIQIHMDRLSTISWSNGCGGSSKRRVMGRMMSAPRGETGVSYVLYALP